MIGFPLETDMPITPVNLDGLIPREYFEVEPEAKLRKMEESPKMKIMELDNDSFMFTRLRKPDFQRTTAHWTPVKLLVLSRASSRAI